MVVEKTTLLIILDGWGVADIKQKGNPITPKNAPNFFGLIKKYPYSELEASAEAVGLEKGQEGNSEAGHLNLGAGRVVEQDALYISKALKDGTFFKNSAFLQALHHAKKYNTAVHLMGLMSNHNSAHSCPEHLYALLDLLHEQGMKKVYLHLFTDGRDSGQHDAAEHLKLLEKHFHGNEKVATVMGRLYGMDRNKLWERTEKAYLAITAGIGEKVNNAQEAITRAYNRGESDEFILPTIIVEDKRPVVTIKDNDVILFFNLRSDRTRQLTKAFVQTDFEKVNPDCFTRKKIAKNIRFVALTDFGPDLSAILTAFPSRDVDKSLVQVLCPRRQLYIAESEKFAHVTYFFNGGYAQHFCDERWVKIDSNPVMSYDLDPKMKTKEIADYVCGVLQKKEFEFIVANFAAADMVGHTGNFAAAEVAVRAIDEALEKIIEVAEKVGACCLITADHGNAEEMINNKTGEIDSEHSVSPVPLILVASETNRKSFGMRGKKLNNGKLADVAPTILKIMGMSKPKEMTGKALF